MSTWQLLPVEQSLPSAQGEARQAVPSSRHQ
jgi:hypothetical protein